MVLAVRSRALSRHPAQLGPAAALAVSSVIQLVAGPSPVSPSSGLPEHTRSVVYALFVLSCLAITIGAYAHPRREPFAMWVELSGLLGIGLGLSALVYLLAREQIDWEKSSVVWLAVGLAGSFLARAVQVGFLIHRFNRLMKTVVRVEGSPSPAQGGDHDRSR